MTVLSVAYPFAPVSPDAAGGAEQILAILDGALVRAGHRSLVLACKRSAAAGELIEIDPPPGLVDEDARRTAHARWSAAISRAVSERRVDVVHLHGVDFHAYLPPEGVPTVVTLHLPPSFYPAESLAPSSPCMHLVCVSDSQRRACPPAARIAATIENGIEFDCAPAAPRGRDGYAMALGRICPEKGFHLALDAAERAGVPLHLGGKVFPYKEHLTYYERDLAPRLKPPHRFLGPLDRARKMACLSRARCLLVPSLVAETSSLVAMEAMSVGTPVVAFPSGALADLIDHGRTGFLAGTVDEMAAAIHRADEIDPAECRRVAGERFAADRMAEQYLELYSGAMR